MILLALLVINIVVVFRPKLDPRDFSLPHRKKGLLEMFESHIISHVKLLLGLTVFLEFYKLSIIISGFMEIVDDVCLLNRLMISPLRLMDNILEHLPKFIGFGLLRFCAV